MDYLFYQNSNYKNQSELFNDVGADLLKKKIVLEGFSNALVVREEEYPTGLPTSPAVAIPHTDGTFVLKDSIVFIKNDREITFHEMGGDDDDIIETEIVIMLVIKSGERHLKTLQKIIEVIQEGRFQKELLATSESIEMEAVVKKYF